MAGYCCQLHLKYSGRLIFRSNFVITDDLLFSTLEVQAVIWCTRIMLPGLVTRNVRTTLGTDKVKGSQCIAYVQRGLAAGYRCIDTAQVYMNEEDIGQAIREYAIPREQVHVTTKISAGFKRNPSSFGEVMDSARGSLTKLGLGYVDTILIHHPGDDVADPEAADRRQMTWQGLEAMVEEGQVRSIGVSNFDISHLNALKRYARMLPTVNQIEVIILVCIEVPTTDFDKFSYTHGANGESWWIIARTRKYHYRHTWRLLEIVAQVTKGL
jgi:diketogulonate reductase-like aldo/keto reductase